MKCNTGNNNSMFGKHHSDETRHKMSESATGRKHADETKEKIGAAQVGKKRETKICPWCKTEMAVNMYARYHGDKCKNKPLES